MVNSVNPDQTLHSAAFDLGLHCLLTLVCLNTCTVQVKILFLYVKDVGSFLAHTKSNKISNLAFDQNCTAKKKKKIYFFFLQPQY